MSNKHTANDFVATPLPVPPFSSLTIARDMKFPVGEDDLIVTACKVEYPEDGPIVEEDVEVTFTRIAPVGFSRETCICPIIESIEGPVEKNHGPYCPITLRRSR